MPDFIKTTGRGLMRLNRISFRSAGPFFPAWHIYRRRGRGFEQKEAKVTKGFRSGFRGKFIREFFPLESRLET
jgi:hypothetical protein